MYVAIGKTRALIESFVYAEMNGIIRDFSMQHNDLYNAVLWRHNNFARNDKKKIESYFCV